MKLVKIKNIREIEDDYVYDITVNHKHNFFANNILVHNCHNYGTNKLLKLLNSKPFKYKLGLSATLERMDGNHWELLKMFNYNVFKYTPKEALRDDILNPFNFYNIGIQLDNKTKDEYDFLTQQINSIMIAGGGYNRIILTSGILKNKMLSLMTERKQLVNNYYKKFDIAKILCKKHKHDKVIVFNQFNEQTNKLYWHLLDDDINARIIHSGIDDKKREETIIDFKNDKFNILLTTKVLDEGFNLPKLDVAIILAGDSTAKQTIQRMGRVLRKKDKNSILYQVYCIDTIEQEYGDERAKLFKDLSCDYDDYFYDNKGDLLELEVSTQKVS